MAENIAQPKYTLAARLLVVDDEPNIRSPLARALSLLGYSVEEASSGREALALLDRTPYDLIVLDMHMPEIDGVEVMHRARQQHPELLIIVLTGHATLDSAIAAVRLEAADYLRKPVTILEILKAVARALDKRTERLQRQSRPNAVDDRFDYEPQSNLWPGSAVPVQISLPRFVRVHPLSLDIHRRLVTVGNNPAHAFELTAGETAILAGLMTHSGRVLSCRQLVHMALGRDLPAPEAQSVVRPHISRLRHKLEAVIKKPRLIRTVRKRGYYFVSDETDARSEKRRQNAYSPSSEIFQAG